MLLLFKLICKLSNEMVGGSGGTWDKVLSPCLQGFNVEEIFVRVSSSRLTDGVVKLKKKKDFYSIFFFHNFYVCNVNIPARSPFEKGSMELIKRVIQTPRRDICSLPRSTWMVWKSIHMNIWSTKDLKLNWK